MAFSDELKATSLQRMPDPASSKASSVPGGPWGPIGARFRRTLQGRNGCRGEAAKLGKLRKMCGWNGFGSGRLKISFTNGDYSESL